MSESNGKYPPAYIEDGYTRTVFIDGIERLHPPVRMTFRPMLAKEWARVAGRMAEQDGGKADELSSELIGHQVIEWDIKKPSGTIIDPKNALEIARIQPKLKQRLFNIVIGQDGGDEDPVASEIERVLGSDDRMSSILAGSSIETEATDEKN